MDRLLRDGDRVTGVAAGEDELYADVVIAADGANSFLAQEAGLRGRIPTHQIAVGVKELIGLPRETIEERFHLAGDEGAAYAIVGFATGGVAGGGFLYTNKESLSVGLVMQLDELLASRRKPADILDEFLAHPMVAGLVRGGKLLEYGAHLVPEGGIEMMPRLAAGGMLVVGDAAGFTINNGFVVRGMDLAIGSAIAAADAVLEAKARGDFSEQGLSLYQQKLELLLRDGRHAHLFQGAAFLAERAPVYGLSGNAGRPDDAHLRPGGPAEGTPDERSDEKPQRQPGIPV